MSDKVEGEKIRAARISVISNTTLVVLKLAVGLAIGSVSVVSEAFHSLSDLVASWIALWTVRISDRPADEDHAYGHGKFESLSGLAEALLILVAAVYILYESIHKLRFPEPMERVDLGLAVMVASAVVNWFVASYLFRVARKTDSLALEADAEHLRIDVWTSLGVVAGLALVACTGRAYFDPLVALAVALMMLTTSVRLILQASHPLLDAQLPAEEIESVRQVFRSDSRVLGFHKLRTRKSGSHRHVDAHVQLEDSLTLLEAHDVTEDLEDQIRETLPNTSITLHTEPFRAEQRHQYEKHGGPPPEDDAWDRSGAPPTPAG